MKVNKYSDITTTATGIVLTKIKTPRKRKAKNEEKSGAKISKSKSKRKKCLTMKCPICFNNFDTESVSSTICGHVFCTECLLKAVRFRPSCPTCRRSLRGSKAHHKLFLDDNACEWKYK